MSAFGQSTTECRVERLNAVDSTNSEAMRQAAQGERGPKWIVAGVQTSGRGRIGRGWQSLCGNLHASLLFVPRCAQEELPQLALVAGVGLFDAVRGLGGGGAVSDMRLKWPNDLLIDRAKVGGILVEGTRLNGDLVGVVGLGLNVAEAPVVDGRDVTALADAGLTVSLDEVFGAVSQHVGQWLGVWQEGGRFGDIVEAWTARAHRPGEALRVAAGDEIVEGGFAGLDATGALLLDVAGGGVRRFTFGDVSLAACGGAYREMD